MFWLILTHEPDTIMVQSLDYEKIAFQTCMKKQLSFCEQSQTLYRQAEKAKSC
jgi:hypothetical protein